MWRFSDKDYFLSRELNNFDALRLLAAIGVIVTHAYAVTASPEGDWLGRATQGAAVWSSFSVRVFFVISGYLVTQSLRHSRSFAHYARKRVLRIFPALAVFTFLAVFVLGPLMTVLSLTEYFQKRETWEYFLMLSLYYVPFELPGVFLNTLYPKVVNPSVWTLAYEFSLYMFLAAACWFTRGFLRRQVMIWLWIVIFFVRLVMPEELHAPLLYTPLLRDPAIDYFLLFLAGSCAFLYHDVFRIHAGHVVLVSIFWLASFGTRFAAPMNDVAIPVFTLWAAFLNIPQLRNISRYGDYSYGLYIYGWPVQQLLSIILGQRLSPLTFSMVSIICIFPFAWTSWHFIEKRALHMR